ncbi:ABC transporter substrate-binding protein [Arthrobacter agilis]|uniref:ABC transporter substrate-binding protein n=1 Tax=Arthrobacter agilis TaxID=37921 RepID=UPI00277F6A31|nr:ABC transporter substrate-binding protein [Arthrobacter agilis]MDQ0735370.1 peptide/nickel transport system substrate-binding protein [Arthrobacter agilis]
MKTPAARRIGPGRARRGVLPLTAVLTAASLVSCTAGEVSPPQPSAAATTPAAEASTFTFGTAADPRTLDPALANDTESYRVSQQIMEGLVGVDPLTSEPTPLLAEAWEEQDDGRTYEFTLRDDVVFHDGLPFDAQAVCANFDRWYQLPAAARAGASRLPFENVFKAFSDRPEATLYEGCTATAEHTVDLHLRKRITGLIPALAAPAFAISSPAALRSGAADELSETRDGMAISRYGLAPVGTGPFSLVSWTPGAVDLAAFPRYWGERGEIQKVAFTTIPNPDSRARALTSGRIDGYDFVSVDSAVDLARNGLQFLQRDPYSVLYLGMNQAFPGVDDPLFRQAVAHAIDKDALIDGRFLNGTKPARQFVPEKLGVSNDTVADYGYDLDLAKELLEESGYDGRELPFYYPRNVSRAYLPSPEKAYAELSRQLTEAGFNIKPVPVEWSDGYVAAVQKPGDRAFHLLGWSGSYEDPDNFVGALFGSRNDEFGYDDPQLFSKINRARGLPNGEDRTTAYASISSQIAGRIPAVPLAFPISALAMSARVTSYPVSPVMREVFNRIDLADAEPLPDPSD